MFEHGQLDLIIEKADQNDDDLRKLVEATVGKVVTLLLPNGLVTEKANRFQFTPSTESDRSKPFDYTNARKITRPQV